MSSLLNIEQLTQNPLQATLVALGAFVILQFLLTALNGFYAHFLRSGKNLKKTYGEWAVVTGATDGIGKAMAFELAKKGLNIILISRSMDKLTETRTELEEKYPKTQVHILSIDFSKFDEIARKSVTDLTKDLDIGVLVNNVGISYPYTKYFHELDDERVTQLMSLNIESTTWMTRVVLPGMVTRKRGAIVNLGSAAGVTISPLLAEYSGAKSYVAMFSKSMCAEYAKFNIHVQCQIPLFVATKLAKIKKTSLFVPSPAGYARAAIAAIGYESLISPFWTHALQLWLMSVLPEAIVVKLTHDMHLDIRKKGMKKDAAAAAGEDDKKKA